MKATTNSSNCAQADSLNIGVIASTYPRHEKDYAVPWMRESLSRITQMGHRVSVIAPSYKGLRSHKIDDTRVNRFRYAPTNWETLTHEQGAPNKIHRPWIQTLAVPYVASGTIAAWRAARKEQFDVVHVHWPFPHGVMGVAAARSCGAALVMNCHGAEFAVASRKKWVQPILAWSLRAADAVVANSSDTAAKIKALSGREAVVIPYGATIDSYVRSPQPQARRGPHKLLFTGRLIERKGVEYLLRAMTRLLHNYDVELVITGDGDQRLKLEALAKELRVQEHTRFVGFVSLEDLNRHYAECDVWVNPSVVDSRGDTEGLGVGSIEAYAHCKPVVASAVGGIPDTVVNDKTGLLVPEKNDWALAQAIGSLLANPEKARQMGEAGLAFAKRKYDWAKITDRLVDVYREGIDRVRVPAVVCPDEAVGAHENAA